MRRWGGRQSPQPCRGQSSAAAGPNPAAVAGAITEATADDAAQHAAHLTSRDTPGTPPTTAAGDGTATMSASIGH